MSRYVYTPVTIIPALPGFFLAEFFPAEGDEAAYFLLHPIIGWGTQAHYDFMVSNRDGVSLFDTPCHHVTVSPILPQGTPHRAGLMRRWLIKHPDGRFSEAREPIFYEDQTEALKALTKQADREKAA